jgi:hypothetical protein
MWQPLRNFFLFDHILVGTGFSNLDVEKTLFFTFCFNLIIGTIQRKRLLCISGFGILVEVLVVCVSREWKYSNPPADPLTWTSRTASGLSRRVGSDRSSQGESTRDVVSCFTHNYLCLGFLVRDLAVRYSWDNPSRLKSVTAHLPLPSPNPGTLDEME